MELTPEQTRVCEAARHFALQEVAPLAREIDERDEFPRELIRTMGRAGYFALELPEPWSNAVDTIGPADALAATLACEEVARASASVGNIFSATRITAFALNVFGSDHLKRRWLPSLVQGDATISFAVTEPGAGSDVRSMATTAVPDRDDYVLNGEKALITFAPIADAYLVLCYLDRSLDTRGTAVLLVERDRPGVSAGEPERKLGQLGVPIGGVRFDEVRVPKANLLGEEGQGFKIAMASLDVTRIDIASISLGLSRAALETALCYARNREQFGQKLTELQAIQFMLADMATEIEAGRGLVRRAAAARSQGGRFTYEAAMAKLFCSDNCMRHTTNAIQILGGRGYTKAYDVERYFRDAKVLQIYDGTSEIQKLVIARQLVA